MCDKMIPAKQSSIHAVLITDCFVSPAYFMSELFLYTSCGKYPLCFKLGLHTTTVLVVGGCSLLSLAVLCLYVLCGTVR